MTESTLVLLACLAIITVLAILIYVAGRNRLTDCELRRTLDQVLAGRRPSRLPLITSAAS
jgi:hypothetical protein